jgi:hypothetical protein
MRRGPVVARNALVEDREAAIRQIIHTPIPGETAAPSAGWTPSGEIDELEIAVVELFLCIEDLKATAAERQRVSKTPGQRRKNALVRWRAKQTAQQHTCVASGGDATEEPTAAMDAQGSGHDSRAAQPRSPCGIPTGAHPDCVGSSVREGALPRSD